MKRTNFSTDLWKTVWTFAQIRIFAEEARWNVRKSYFPKQILRVPWKKGKWHRFVNYRYGGDKVRRYRKQFYYIRFNGIANTKKKARNSFRHYPRVESHISRNGKNDRAVS